MPLSFPLTHKGDGVGIFLGDYSGIAAIPGGGVALLWTDMCASICFAGRCGATEDAEYATAP